MATYFPPTEDLPIFDSAVFGAANSEGISAAEVAAQYLKRTGVVFLFYLAKLVRS